MPQSRNIKQLLVELGGRGGAGFEIVLFSGTVWGGLGIIEGGLWGHVFWHQAYTFSEPFLGDCHQQPDTQAVSSDSYSLLLHWHMFFYTLVLFALGACMCTFLFFLFGPKNYLKARSIV